MKCNPFFIFKVRLLCTFFLFLSTVLLAQPEFHQRLKPDSRYSVLFNMVHHNPGEPRFSTKYTNPEYIEDLGYNGQVLKMEVQCGLTYDDWEDNVIPEDSEEKMWILRHAASVRTKLGLAEKAGIPVYPFIDMLVLPISILEKYKSELMEGDRLSIRKPKTQELIRAQIKELFIRYPTLDGITTRHGETYLHDTPFHKGGSPVGSPEEHAILINLLREEVCIKRNKKLFYRTWDFDGFHVRPDFYLAATNAVEPHPLLYFSVKHTNADFLRNYPFNKTIGLGKHQQIVEVSMNQAGLYGRNGHPYYIGTGIIEGWPEMDHKKGLQDLYDDPKIKGVWTWCWGDGWVGPYFDNELWVDLNEYVIRTYVCNPKRSEQEIFETYAKEELRLSDTDAQKLRELCMLSVDAVFYGQDTNQFQTIPWYIRDHYMTGIRLENVVKNNIVDTILSEKASAVKKWYKMEALSKEIQMSNAEDKEFLEVSTTYGRIKYEIIEQIWKIQILLAQHEQGKKMDKKAAQKAVDTYHQKWKEWRALRKQYPSCPTLYVDHKAVHIQWFEPFQKSLEQIQTLL